ncbi:nucleotidyltransferase domain-containing protein [Methylobacter tundripaludum]|uniref:DNA polymerase beta domain protein region n=1 Tax=Methylobacter tundripaludum (strain ATCC BAA-1195 / DSM 17260 / SV96) TaxID=697282 RepID=G3IYN9_METTV|nr:nucleotidyltransferase domain-containing protein [Methylobacter tundripaludum]EGW20087.1 DNA polymerase beta domain protein region [Methylobacter tundripaludum SV96]
MRIAPSAAQVIKETASTVFGKRVAVWLFGSRSDDVLKGVDIDLCIEIPPEDYAYAKKLRFGGELVKRFGGQKIDIVMNKIDALPRLPIYDALSAKEIRLGMNFSKK